MILQFGTSRFLQAHVDLFAHQAADAGQDVPGITIVQTSGDPARAERLRGFADPAGFPVILRGVEKGATVDHTIRVRSVVDGLSVVRDWDAIVRLFVGSVTHVVSNSGDTGYDIAAADRSPAILDGGAPHSFPSILLALLHRRWLAGGATVTLLPCELVAKNGAVLRELVAGLAEEIGADTAFRAWLTDGCIWANTLVDRIVSEPIDPVGAVAEPYALWAVERQPGLALPFMHPSVMIVDALEPYERLKLHILNLGHSWLAERWHQAGAHPAILVRDLLDDPVTLLALEWLYAAEVIPGFAARGLGEEAARYVDATIERFRNPFLDHRMADIHAHHAAKVAKRISGFVRWVDGAVALPELEALAAAHAPQGVAA